MASTKSISLPSLGPNAATTVLTIIDGAPRIAPPALSGLNIVGEFAAPAALSSATEIETDVLSSVPEVEEVIETPVPPAAPIMLLGLAAIAGFVRRRL
ncbi:MAG: hypothetical protein HKN14_00960 [Marinicaulis sp.]|nr:hypothetical protein [Marinicaulis sp.]NNE39466.1 hypothetical protein [Marinicaulis sp.]NNL90134.1 hypothetical protein [Marinicaulis sp.]